MSSIGHKGPCTQIVFTLGPMYLYREYFQANVYTIWVHGLIGNRKQAESLSTQNPEQL